MKWVEDERVVKSAYIKDLVENMLAFVIYISYRRSFQNVLRWDSPHSNNLLTVFDKIGNVEPTWIAMRNFKGLLNRWI